MACPFNPRATVQEPHTESGDSEEIPIPQPPTHFLTHNLTEIDPNNFNESLVRLSKLYGPIYKLDMGTSTMVVVSNYKFINEVCDDNKTEKSLGEILLQVRNLLKDGLFTAYSDEPNWFKAHRTLVPAFGPLGIRKMFSQMVDICSQMVLRWDRLGPDNEILTSDDFTIYNMHPFAVQMADVLIESGKRATMPSLVTAIRYWSAKKYQENTAEMHKLCDVIVADRRKNPKPEVNDLLNVMLSTPDPVTGEKLSDENIRFQMATFLVAGHETTSGTLCFLFYHLLKNPEKLQAAQKEVDEVVGDDELKLEHLSKLKYCEAAYRETLRFKGPISTFGKHVKQSMKLAGRYRVNPKDFIFCSLAGLHYDPEIWGEDAAVFRPERMLNGGWEKIPRNGWKAFGDGVRACIGRGFAEQEMMIAIALILQRFQPQMVDPSYDLKIKSTLTIKPDDFRIKVRRRPGKADMVGLPGGGSSAPFSISTAAAHKAEARTSSGKSPMLVLFGSNSGTCKAFAEDIQSKASDFGLEAEVKTLDDSVDHLPTDRPVVIISPSYEGRPADNAKGFVAWLEANAAASNTSKLKGVRFTVFGVGNSEWYATFHRIPKLINDVLPQLGATSFYPAGFSDVKEDLVGPWEKWTEGLWDALRESTGTTEKVETSELKVNMEKSSLNQVLAGEEIGTATVKVNRELCGDKIGLKKMHMEVELPQGTSYETGDYLVVLPYNQKDTVGRVLNRFQIQADDIVSISGTKKAFLQSNSPRSIYDLLTTSVELNTPATQHQIESLVKYSKDPKEKEHLQSFVTDNLVYQSEILAKRYSILDLLDDYPSCALPFSIYLDMLKPLTPRQYSVSSSPLANTSYKPPSANLAAAPADPSTESDENARNDAPAHEDQAKQGAPILTTSITYDVHSLPALSSSPTSPRPFHGVASSYLASLSPNTPLRALIRSTNRAFHLPPSASTPLILICAGTGIAPMRGFLQERASVAQARKSHVAFKTADHNPRLGKALLYFGCRDFENDYIYKDELEEWEKLGVVSLRPGFSKRAPEGQKKWYVTDRMWEEREEIRELFMGGAKVFVCGSAGKLAKSSAEVCKRIHIDAHPGTSEKEADMWLEGIREVRYVSDVFG